MSSPADDALTAREQLHREAMWGLLHSGVDDAGTAADQLINAYAHELADKILAASEASERQGHSMTPSELADLIRSEMP